MTCLCGATHDVEGSVECECGLVLMEVEELTEAEGAEAAMERDTPIGLDDDGGCDDEPGDIDSDEGYDPYTGGAEDEGYDRGCFDDCDF